MSQRTGHEGEKGHGDSIGPSLWDRGQGMEEKEKKLRDCLKDVFLALGMKTKGPHLNLGMASRLGSPYWK